MPTNADRLSQLRAMSEDFTGISFVQVVDVCDQRVLRVYFHTDPADLNDPFEGPGSNPLTLSDIRIYSPRSEAEDVRPNPDPALLIWADDTVLQRRYLQMEMLEPGTFTDYRLRIMDSRIDPGFNDVRFSFKVGCDDDLDCAEQVEQCDLPTRGDVDVDYLARDFVSLRNALLDFTAQRYPNWQTPLEADVGMVPLELIAALGDEFSYLQDRYNREAYLETATERRSLRRKARLIDFEIHDGRQASTVLEMRIAPGVTSLPAGAAVWALAERQDPIAFELGSGLQDVVDGLNFSVDARWNAGLITPYAMDDDTACLRSGTTELLVRNDPAGPDNPGGVVFAPGDPALWEGRALLLRDRAEGASETERLVQVTVEAVELTTDPLFSLDLARIIWRQENALRAHIPLAELELSGNIIPATAGQTQTQSYRLGPLQPGDPAEMLSAVEREGPLHSLSDPSALTRRDPCTLDEDDSTATRPPIYLLSLPGTETQGLAFMDPESDLRASLPELRVTEDGQPNDPWEFQRSLLLCGPNDQVVSIEDGTWAQIVHYQSGEERVTHADYASGEGYTVRFPDGEFGRLPPRDAVFHVQYRLGSGRRANLPTGAIIGLSIPNQTPPHIGPLAALVEAVSNPFVVTNGMDPESASDIKSLAPDAYRAETFFAVRPEDYGTQAAKLASVQQAQGAFRWTGSWLSATVAVDPADTSQLNDATRQEVQTLLDARRQAGRQVIVVPPRYINLDLQVTVCLTRDAFAGQVQPHILGALFGAPDRTGRAFFDPDNFTFGTPLRRLELEATIAAVPGVESVIDMKLRIHGVTDFEPFANFVFETADDELIRLENTAQFPERGSLQLSVVGGA